MNALLFMLVLAQVPDGPVDYTRDIKPMLARHCVACHGAEKPRAGLRLDTSEAARRGGISGPALMPGQPGDSLLLLAVQGDDGLKRMPLNRPPLPPADIEKLHSWIAAGAQAPDDEKASIAPPPETHWAFLAPDRTTVPQVRDSAWCRNTIDPFILAKLEHKNLAPSEMSDRPTLIRRVTLDLIGVPPTPQEVAAFLADEHPDAFERVVDRLLASPHYGERWARPWLDLARYADSNGYSIDAPRTIWPYRDWVINALNADLPFDEFGIEQLAGDLLPHATLQQRIATGFHRNTPINQEGGIDKEQFRVESIIDRTNTTATVFLGLTMGCAQCHDHKYDPISQKEYYQLFAFFNNDDEPEIPVASVEQVAERNEVESQAAAYLERIWRDEPALREAMRSWELGLDMEDRQKQSQEVREAFDVPFEQRAPDKQRIVFAAFVDQASNARAHKRALDALRRDAPHIVTTLALSEAKSARITHLLAQGDFTRPGAIVSPQAPRALRPVVSAGDLPTRLDLARWLFSPENPLTARVTVNRCWQAYFGRGLVETENDFGTQGSYPSHPELLDWLACEFRDGRWSQKALHRLIVTSATYRQASCILPESFRLDPSNRLFGRQSRLRLDAELIRDSALAASGLLTRHLGGPSVFPPQPEGIMTLGQMRRPWNAATGPDRYRRGLYTFLWRATPHPLLSLFDVPDPSRACTRRERSNTPLQALMLLNDQAFIECAEGLANRVLSVETNDTHRLEQAFQLCLARGTSAPERARLLRLIEQVRADASISMPPGDAERTAWVALARVLLNLDEFLTRE